MNENNRDQTRRLIEEYNRQLMAVYRQSSPPTAPGKSSPSAATATDTAWLEENFPLPDIERDKQAIVSDTQPMDPSLTTPQPNDPQFPYTDDDLRGEVPRANEASSPPSEVESAYIGYLRVFTFTGQSAEPIEGATVAVTRPQADGQELYATTITNADGFTPALPLPSVSPALTMRPDIPNPYIAYDVRVSAPGFRPVIYENIPVYGNNFVTQSANLLPLIPGQEANDPLVVRSGAPTNL